MGLAESDGTTVKTLELSREFFEEDEQGVEVFAKAVTALNDEDGMILDEDTTNFLYLVQVHNTYKFFDSMAIKIRKEVISILSSMLKWSNSSVPSWRKNIQFSSIIAKRRRQELRLIHTMDFRVVAKAHRHLLDTQMAHTRTRLHLRRKTQSTTLRAITRARARPAMNHPILGNPRPSVPRGSLP